MLLSWYDLCVKHEVQSIFYSPKCYWRCSRPLWTERKLQLADDRTCCLISVFRMKQDRAPQLKDGLVVEKQFEIFKKKLTDDDTSCSLMELIIFRTPAQRTGCCTKQRQTAIATKLLTGVHWLHKIEFMDGT